MKTTMSKSNKKSSSNKKWLLPLLLLVLVIPIIMVVSFWIYLHLQWAHAKSAAPTELRQALDSVSFKGRLVSNTVRDNGCHAYQQGLGYAGSICSMSGEKMYITSDDIDPEVIRVDGLLQSEGWQPAALNDGPEKRLKHFREFPADNVSLSYYKLDDVPMSITIKAYAKDSEVYGSSEGLGTPQSFILDLKSQQKEGEYLYGVSSNYVYKETNDYWFVEF